MDFVQYLSGKGYTGRRATGNEVMYPCFFDCNEPPDSRKRKLYVNGETGKYSCKVCVSEGGSTLLLRHFGDDPKGDDDVQTPAPRPIPIAGRRSAVLEHATAFGEKCLAQNDRVAEYLLGPRRFLSPETIVNRRLGWADRHWKLTANLPAEEHYTREDLLSSGLLARSQSGGDYEYYSDRVLIPYIESGRVVQIRGKDIDGRYYTPINDPVYLYNVDSLIGASEAVLVEGEFDTMMLAELLVTSTEQRIRTMAVIGIAGTGAIPEDFAQRISHLKRVFIGTDPDVAGRKAAENLKDRLGSRGHIIEWPKELVAGWIANGHEVKELDWTTWIGQLGATVDEVAELLTVKGRLKSALQSLILHRNRPTTGWKFGFSGLDATFSPGLLPGQVAVFISKTGVGKTIILCNLAYNQRRYRVLFITLEMTAEEIWVRLARIYRFWHPFASDETIARAYPLLRICDANRLDEKDFAALVEEYTDDVGMPPELAYVDYLGYYARGRRGGSQYEKTSDAIMQLKAEAKTYGMGIITPAQVSRKAEDGKPIESDMARDSGAIEETADLLVGMWRPDDALNLQDGGIASTGKLHLIVLKSRHGGRDAVYLMQMGRHSLVVVDSTSPHAHQAKRECDAVADGITYDRYIESIRNTERELT